MEKEYPARKYIVDMFSAFTVNYRNLFEGDNSYYGRLGSMKAAHEKAFYDIGLGLADYTEKERRDAMQISYGQYVKFCSLKPIIAAKEMIKKMQEGIDGRN